MSKIKPIISYANVDTKKITCTISAVSGILTSMPQISMSSSYDKLISIDLSQLNKYAAAAGKSWGTTGFFTRRVFTGGSYLSLQIAMRVVDWEGNGYPAWASKTLLGYSMVGSGAAESLASAMSRGKSTINSGVGGDVTSESPPASDGADSGSGVASGLSSTLGSVFSGQNLDKNVPSNVSVTIGNFFSNRGVEMNVHNVGVTFSKEMGSRGPIYADFSVTVASREMFDAGTMQSLFTIGSENPRFTVK